MLAIIALLHCLHPTLTTTTLGQMGNIIPAILIMSGRVTMRGISRWTDTGGSYRSVQRFFCTAIPWAMVFWLFVRQHLLCPEDIYLLAGDEVVVPKAGKKTHGLERFFSGLYHKTIPGLSFFTLSLVSIKERHSFPVRVQQVIRTEAEKALRKAQTQSKQAKTTGKRGRPKGSKNKNKAPVSLSPELERIASMLQAQLVLMAGGVRVKYLALDGHFGNHCALQMVRGCDLHLISKLRADSALYFAYEGAYCGHGPHRKYGDKINYRQIPSQYLKQATTEDSIETHIYQAPMLHKEFSEALNVVLLVKTNRQTGARAHVVLFSSDQELCYADLIEYYRLRFQIEFNFRDAKQYFGLDDFMNVEETAVTNAANLSLFLVNVVYVLLGDFRRSNPAFSILDLKAYCRGYKYVMETIKMLPEKPDENTILHVFHKVTTLGSIHSQESPLNHA